MRDGKANKMAWEVARQRRASGDTIKAASFVIIEARKKIVVKKMCFRSKASILETDIPYIAIDNSSPTSRITNEPDQDLAGLRP